jgi:hypothetical protein
VLFISALLSNDTAAKTPHSQAYDFFITTIGELDTIMKQSIGKRTRERYKRRIEDSSRKMLQALGD